MNLCRCCHEGGTKFREDEIFVRLDKKSSLDQHFLDSHMLKPSHIPRHRQINTDQIQQSSEAKYWVVAHIGSSGCPGPIKSPDHKIIFLESRVEITVSQEPYLPVTKDVEILSWDQP